MIQKRRFERRGGGRKLYKDDVCHTDSDAQRDPRSEINKSKVYEVHAKKLGNKTGGLDGGE